MILDEVMTFELKMTTRKVEGKPLIEFCEICRVIDVRGQRKVREYLAYFRDMRVLAVISCRPCRETLLVPCDICDLPSKGLEIFSLHFHAAWKMDGPTSRNASKAWNYLQQKLPPNLRCPAIGVICGSGLDIIDLIPGSKVEIPYAEVPDFPKTTGVILITYMIGTSTAEEK